MIELKESVKKLEQTRLFTEAYRECLTAPEAVREIKCLAAQYPYSLLPIEQDDLFAGRLDLNVPVQFSPQISQHGFGYVWDDPVFEGLLEQSGLDESGQRLYRELQAFWLKENTKYKTRQRYPKEMAAVLPSDNWNGEPGAAFPLYRMAGLCLDFDKLLNLGLPGMRDLVRGELERQALKGGDAVLFESMLSALDLLEQCLLYYANQAEEAAKCANAAERASGLEEMAKTLRMNAVQAPHSFREAIQLLWMYAMLAQVRNYGRMDVYLGDFLVKDLQNGIIDEAKALELLQSLWRLMAARKTTVDSRVIIGGYGRRNEANADRFAFLAMEATRTVLEIEPQLSLRWHEGMNPQLFEKALEVIGEGRTFPILYNDDINVPAVQHAFDVSREQAEQYVPFGCGEFVLNHMSVGTPSGLINMTKVLELTLHNGVDPATGQQLILRTGEASSFAAFDDLLDAYKRQLKFLVEALADQEALEYRVAGETAPFLFVSMLYDDCIAQGKGVFAGGVRHLGGTLETYGSTTAADSLFAIKEWVYNRKLCGLEQLTEILDSDYAGHELVRKQLFDLPKYGNNLPEPDQMVLWQHDFICNLTRNQRDRTELDSYLVVNINNSANVSLGEWTGASADGRKARQPLTNGNTPGGGCDRNGITALLQSIAKPDPSVHAGMVQNMKFGKEVFLKDREKLSGLIKTYFAKGGTQSMITCVSRGELENAMQDPEKYTHVFVRVGGFSARFVELPHGLQLDILNRTLY